MVTKERKIKEYCCLYASKFHLEMILLPYIKNRMYKSNVYIYTNENLSSTLKILLERVNLKTEEKNKILEIKNWDNVEFEKTYINNNIEYTIIINGDEEYKKKIKEKLKNVINNVNITNIVDCYDINDEKIETCEIRKKYSKILNTEEI